MSAVQSGYRFSKKALDWVMYRLRLRAPNFWAKIEAELPLRDGTGLYTEVLRSNSAIPNVVYQTWTTPLFGRTHLKHLERFRARNPDHSFRFFSDNDIAAYMEKQFGTHQIFEIFNNCCFGPMRTDIWRYCILLERGGIYCDIGKNIGIPFSQLVQPEATTVLSWERRGTSPFRPSTAARERLQHPDKVVINWALMSAPGHPLLKRAIDGIVEKYPSYKGRIFESPKSAILKFTGPVHLTECVLAAAEAGELDSALQAGVEFQGSADWGVPGAWVRYAGRPPYELARGRAIVV